MSRSEALFERAKHTIPGGVNSPVRAFKAVGGTPRFMERAEGAYLFDADGKRYIDYVLSWGPMIMGHNHPRVREAVVEAAQSGLSFGCPTEIEIELAETISKLVPSMPLVRMTSSGTEATMSAIRLARGFTGRDKIIKFEGLLSRPFRFPADQGGLRCPDVWRAQLAGRAGSAGTTHRHPAL